MPSAPKLQTIPLKVKFVGLQGVFRFVVDPLPLVRCGCPSLSARLVATVKAQGLTALEGLLYGADGAGRRVTVNPDAIAWVDDWRDDGEAGVAHG